MTNAEHAETLRLDLLDTYGISPALARAWLDTFKITPEEAAQLEGLGSHEYEALKKIALSEDGLYLLDEVYIQTREVFENKQRLERIAQGFTEFGEDSPATRGYTRLRVAELREEALELRKWYEDNRPKVGEF